MGLAERLLITRRIEVRLRLPEQTQARGAVSLLAGRQQEQEGQADKAEETWQVVSSES